METTPVQLRVPVAQYRELRAILIKRGQTFVGWVREQMEKELEKSEDLLSKS